MANSMRAWQYGRTGVLEKTLTLATKVPQPGVTLQNGQILVQIAKAALNHADYKVPAMSAARFMLQMPKTAGVDLSGRVAAIAPDVTNIKVGAPVMARLDPFKAPGSLAEFAVANANCWAAISKDVELDQAAGGATAALAAFQALKGRVKTGDKVFINGGSGGVGSFCVQIAKLLGCHVTVSCSTDKASLCKELGADDVIDYKTTNVTQQLSKAGPLFTLAIDNIGTSPTDLAPACAEYLVPAGEYVFIGAEPSLDLVKNMVRGMLLPTMLGGYARRISVLVTKDDKDDLSQIATWLSERKLKTVVDSTYKFEDAVSAYARLRQGSLRGKVVVHVNDIN